MIEQKQPSAIAILEESKEKLAKALPRHMNVERFLRVVATEINRNPDLLECDSYSVASGVMQCAELGLELGRGLGHASLIPFRNKDTGKKNAQLIIEYKGLISLAMRSGDTSAVWASVVHEGDEFDVELGSDPKIKHKPLYKKNNVTHVYACAKMKDGPVKFEVMDRNEVDHIRNTYSKRPNADAWQKSYSEMAKKTVIKRLAKTLNLSPEVAGAFHDVTDFDADEPKEEARTQRIEKLQTAHEAEVISPASEDKAIRQEFQDLTMMAEKASAKIATSDLYTTPKLALDVFDTKKLQAINQVLRKRLGQDART